jgi:hypothetical protein
VISCVVIEHAFGFEIRRENKKRAREREKGE